MSERTKRPAFQFYPGDWRSDPALRMCSIAARGLWIDMLAVMHDCEPYGVLMFNGRPMTDQQLARLVGEDQKQVRKLLAELEDAGVFSRREDDDAIYSRRMVRDEAVRNARAEGGKAGAEHGVKGASYGKLGGRPRKDKGAKKPPLGAVEKPPLNPPPSTSSPSSPTVTASANAAAVTGRWRQQGERVEISPEWRPSPEDVAFVQQQYAHDPWPPEKLTAVVQKFVTHHRRHGHLSADWSAEWRLWVRNEGRFNGPSTGSQGRRGMAEPARNFELSPEDKARNAAAMRALEAGA